MSLNRIAAILALVLQVLTFVMAQFAEVIPPKIAVYIMVAISVIQSVLPRIQKV